ncbi:MAG: hypothetical protein M1820_002836 [Bogoriella megaspora]|nr:MAG: hypothetical protein M1820_002836 [Bogoriella megaspora]
MEQATQGRFFTSIVPSHESIQIRNARVPHQRKRRRVSEPENAEADAQNDQSSYQAAGEDEIQNSFADPQTRVATISIDDREQCRLAGIERGDPIPAKPFPRAAATYPQRVPLIAQLVSILSNLNPPLYIPSSQVITVNSKISGPGLMGKGAGGLKRTSLRLHHIRVLTTLLHRCVLEGDWDRAGRAWGLLIRTIFNGKHIDIRGNGMWGIGAEILLQRSKETVPLRDSVAKPMYPRSSPSDENDDDASENEVQSESAENRSPDETEPAQTFFSEKGFRQARIYYERLIVQYPKVAKGEQGFLALDFYPAMLSLWVYEVQELSRRKKWDIDRNLQAMRKNNRPSNSLFVSDDDDDDVGPEDGGEYEGSEAERRTELLIDIARKDLHQAREIASRLDDLLLSPHYDVNAYLLELRGHVSLWIGDLRLESVHPGFRADSDIAMQGADKADPDSESATEEALRDRDEEVDDAREFFQRAKEADGILSSTASDVLTR